MARWRWMPALAASIALAVAACGDSGGTDGTEGVAATGASEATYLYTQSAAGGSFEPVEGEAGVYELQLTEVSPRTTWFSDRPERDAGTLETGSALAEIGFDDPPNAVVSLPLGDPTRDAIAVILEDPEYNADQATLRYRATALDGDGGAELARQAEVDGAVPRRFDQVDVFIDDAEPNGIPQCIVRVVNQTSATLVSTSAGRYPDVAFAGDLLFFGGAPRPSPPQADYLLSPGAARYLRQSEHSKRITCGGELHLAVLVDGAVDPDHAVDMWWKDPPEENSDWDCNVRWASGRYPYAKPKCESSGNVTQQPLNMQFVIAE